MEQSMNRYIGQMLDDRYEILEIIGSGGMSVVYKAMCHKLHRYVAVKILRDEMAADAELKNRFQAEAHAVAMLSQPNIVSVYDVGHSGETEYIVMELIEGETLKQRMAEHGVFSATEALHYATQICKALQHAHAHGIVHRDIKPQNIMLLADGSIKMMDFGIARFSRAQSQTVSDKAIGSVHYISPEQAKGDKTDARTDIYSVGVMLYEMLSGKLPFDGDGAVSIAIMQISDKAKPLAQVAPNVPEALCQITEKAMEKDPANRYQSAQEMLEAIEAFKRNPSARFAYEYRNAQDNPERNINRVVNSTKPAAKSAAGTKAAAKSGSNIRTGEARRVGTQNPGRSKKNKKKKGQKPFSLLPIFFGMAVAFVIGAAILIYLIFTNSSNLLFSNRNDVTLISFIGMTEDEFRASEYNSLLKLQKEEEYSDEPAGTIVKQNPKAGRTVKEGQKITLTVSLGTQYITIPETKNMVAEDAEQTLKDMGLRVTKKPMVDATVAPGAVIYTQPAAGETVTGDSMVIVYVSRQDKDKTQPVPSLTGRMLEDARNEIKGKFSVRVVEQASEQPAGTVLSQSPAAGSDARITSAITLVVSTGVPEVVETPTDNGGGDEGGNVIEESWWSSSDGAHQIHQLTDGTMWNENGQQCDAQGNPL